MLSSKQRSAVLAALALVGMKAADAIAASAKVAAVSEQYRREVAAAIAERNRTFERNFAARDTAKMIDDYFVPDELGPIASGPGVPPARGRAAIIADFKRVEEGAPTIRIETIDVTATRDMASEIGRVYLTGSDQVGRVGRYTVLWLRTEKGWRAKMDFFSPDAWQD